MGIIQITAGLFHLGRVHPTSAASGDAGLCERPRDRDLPGSAWASSRLRDSEGGGHGMANGNGCRACSFIPMLGLVGLTMASDLDGPQNHNRDFPRHLAAIRYRCSIW